MDNLHDENTCEYCQALKKVTSPAEEGSCPYCVAAEEAPVSINASECQYCAASQHKESECKYCGRGPEVKNPTTTNSEDFAGQDMNSPDMPKPIMGEDVQELAAPTDVPTTNNALLDDPAGIPPEEVVPQESVQVDQSREALKGIAEQIESQDGVGNGPGPAGIEQANSVDEAALIPNTDIVDGVSRPASYDQTNPGDMGTSSDGSPNTPDLASVFQEGLDANSPDIKREKVIQMVSQALSGFKSCKSIIERSQTQAPQLYQSSIMMLKAMIEMARMLGLDQEQSEQPQDEWQNPFPTHPDQGGSPNPLHGSSAQPQQAAPESEWENPFPTHPENGGMDKTVGQGIGKLPTSKTTKHVVDRGTEPGEVNALGQMRYLDPVTGKESYIDMKQPRVLSNTGKPVKA